MPGNERGRGDSPDPDKIAGSPTSTPHGNRPVGLSRELIEHHARQHRCASREAFQLFCRCGCTILICCGDYREPVFAAVRRFPVCPRAAEYVPGAAA